MTENPKYVPIGEVKTDWLLVQQVLQGDDHSFEAIYQRHRTKVYATCLKMLKRPEEAEELMQESFIQLFRKLGNFRGDAALSTYLHRMTVNQVLMYKRKKYVRLEQTTCDEDELGRQLREARSNHGDKGSTTCLAVREAIGQLAPGYRTVLTLHDFEGCEHKEIAKILGCSEGTSKSQLHKARAKLREILTTPAGAVTKQRPFFYLLNIVQFLLYDPL